MKKERKHILPLVFLFTLPCKSELGYTHYAFTIYLKTSFIDILIKLNISPRNVFQNVSILCLFFTASFGFDT